jgi:long-chain-alcohol oxidase
MAWDYFLESKWPQGNNYDGGIMSSMYYIFYPHAYGTIIQIPSLQPVSFSVMIPWTSALDMKERISIFARTAHIFSLARDKGLGTMDIPRHLTYIVYPFDENNLRKGIEKVLRIIIVAR